MDPTGFLADLDDKPRALGSLADVLEQADPWASALASLDRRFEQVLLIGMGSSTFAAGVAAARLRSRGQPAVAELASSALLPPADERTLVIAVSASGGSVETIAAAQRYVGRSPVIALTNRDESPLSELAQASVSMQAGVESGGVACRSFQHTLALLLALEHRLCGSVPQLASAVRGAAEASDDLLSRRDTWLPSTTELLAGPNGTFVVAPAARLSSAQQSALMVREGPRRLAVSAETGEWSHVDVYLTKTLDYRMLLLPGSAYDDELLRWTSERNSTLVSVGADVEQAQVSLRYRNDSDELVRLLAEVLVAELVAHCLWANP